MISIWRRRTRAVTTEVVALFVRDRVGIEQLPAGEMEAEAAGGTRS